MYGTFNMGIGMVMAVDKEELAKITNYLVELGEEFTILGEIKKGNEGVVLWNL